MKKKITDFFSADRFADYIGIVIDEVDKDKAQCSLIVEDRHLNAKDYIQGGVIFTLADFAFAVAANASSITEKNIGSTVSMSAEIRYIKPGDGKRITATALKVSTEGRISTYKVDITNDRDEVIAEARIKGFTKAK